LSLVPSLLRGGTTLLLITHHPELAARCDRIVPIEDGRSAASLVEAVA